MALDTHTGVFLLDTSVLTGEGTTLSVTGVGFVPKLLLFWSADDVTDLSKRDSFFFSIGFSDGVNERSFGVVSGAQGDPPDAFGRKRGGANALISIDGGGRVDARFNVDSLDADGFTIIIPADTVGQVGTNAPGTDDFVYFMAFGGDDVTEVAIGSFDSADEAEEQIVSSLGLTGVPDYLMVLGADTPAGVDEFQVDGVGTEDLVISVGQATQLNQAVVGVRMRGGVGAFVSQAFDTMREEIVAIFGPSSSAFLQRGFLVALESDAFRIRWLKAAARRMFYLAVRGPSVKVGVGQTPSVPTRAPIPGIGLTPKTILGMCSSLTPTVPGDAAGFGFSFGGGTPDFQRVVTGHNASTGVPQQSRRFVEDGIVRIHNTSGQIRALGRVTEFGNNDLTINWVVSDPPEIRFVYMAMGDTDPAATAVEQFDNVARLTQVGHELGTSLFVTSILWSGATAPGHRVVFGESDTLGDSANEVLRLSSNPANVAVFVPLNVQFLNGLQLTQIDSGTVFVYLQSFSVDLVHVVLTAAADAALIAAPGAGLSLYVTHVFASPIASGNNVLRLKEGVGGTVKARMRMVETGQQIPFDPPWKVPANTALGGELTSASPDVGVTIQHFVAPG